MYIPMCRDVNVSFSKIIGLDAVICIADSGETSVGSKVLATTSLIPGHRLLCPLPCKSLSRIGPNKGRVSSSQMYVCTYTGGCPTLGFNLLISNTGVRDLNRTMDQAVWTMPDLL